MKTLGLTLGALMVFALAVFALGAIMALLGLLFHMAAFFFVLGFKAALVIAVVAIIFFAIAKIGGAATIRQRRARRGW